MLDPTVVMEATEILQKNMEYSEMVARSTCLGGSPETFFALAKMIFDTNSVLKTLLDEMVAQERLNNSKTLT